MKLTATVTAITTTKLQQPFPHNVEIVDLDHEGDTYTIMTPPGKLQIGSIVQLEATNKPCNNKACCKE